MCVFMYMYIGRGQRRIVAVILVFLSTMRVTGIEFRSLDLVVLSFTHISSQYLNFNKWKVSVCIYNINNCFNIFKSLRNLTGKIFSFI